MNTPVCTPVCPIQYIAAYYILEDVALGRVRDKNRFDSWACFACEVTASAVNRQDSQQRNATQLKMSCKTTTSERPWGVMYIITAWFGVDGRPSSKTHA